MNYSTMLEFLKAHIHKSMTSIFREVSVSSLSCKHVNTVNEEMTLTT